MAKTNEPIKRVPLGVMIGYDIEFSKTNDVLFIPTFGSELFGFYSSNYEFGCSTKVTDVK